MMRKHGTARFGSTKRPVHSQPSDSALTSHRRLQLEALEDRRLLDASPYLVKDINPGLVSGLPTFGGALQTILFEANGTAFFSANDGTHGEELWKSDGTEAGTVLLKDILPGSDQNNSSFPSLLANVNGSMFFSASSATVSRGLWKSDGTPEGTGLVKDIWPGVTYPNANPRSGVSFNGNLFFIANDGVHGYELWKSDGSTAGTVMVKDIRVGSGDSMRLVDDSQLPPINTLAILNDAIFFAANDGTGGYELWKSDGTADGTVLVKEIQPGAGGSDPGFFANANGTLYFRANDGTSGAELWKSDGTEAGTMLVRDIQLGGVGSDGLNDGNSRLTSVGGTVFFRADDGTHGRELWKSDGTETGTVLVKDINPGAATSSERFLVDVNGVLFFEANDGVHGLELWKSNGSDAGTSMFMDSNVGSANGVVRPPVNFNGTLFFTATDGTTDRIWKSDGSITGTTLVSSTGIAINNSLVVNGKLFFVSSDAVHGQELWVLDGNGPPALDLNGPSVGTALAGIWSNSGPVPLADPTQATLNYLAGPNLTQLTATLVSPNAGDLLAANTSGTSIVAGFNGSVLTLSGTDTAAHYQQVLRTITYDNTLGGPPVSSLSVQLVASNGAQSSTPATATLAIDPAPTVQSIARYNPSSPNTNATTVQFLATFSEPVEEVDPDDFALALTGSVSGTIFDVYLWTDTAYLVTVNAISGSGTLGLNFVPDGSIIDSIGNTVLNGFVGQTYTIGSPSSTIAGRHIFYNQSVWDGNSAAISAASDNAARATDKTAYLPGAGLAVAANVTSFTRGITGIMVDLSAGGNHAALTASDFEFKVGNNNAPSLWAAAPAPSAISVIPGGGVGGSDRVEITWASGAIRNQWLEVQVKANANTGLVATDVHFWGNKIADSGNTPGAGTFDTTSTDAAQVFASIGVGKPITDLRDYNRDGQVTSTDAALVFANIGSIVRINIGAGGPFAPDADPQIADDGSTSAVALALATTPENASARNAPPKVAFRLRETALHIRRVDECFRQISTEDSPRPHGRGTPVSSTDEMHEIDKELLDALITNG